MDARSRVIERAITLVREFIADEDTVLSDPDLMHKIAKRVREAWTRRQNIIDPNE